MIPDRVDFGAGRQVYSKAMNAQPPTPDPTPVPMVKETITKNDGRFLSYYTFPEEAPRFLVLEEKDTEDADV